MYTEDAHAAGCTRLTHWFLARSGWTQGSERGVGGRGPARRRGDRQELWASGPEQPLQRHMAHHVLTACGPRPHSLLGVPLRQRGGCRSRAQSWGAGLALTVAPLPGSPREGCEDALGMGAPPTRSTHAELLPDCRVLQKQPPFPRMLSVSTVTPKPLSKAFNILFVFTLETHPAILNIQNPKMQCHPFSCCGPKFLTWQIQSFI